MASSSSRRCSAGCGQRCALPRKKSSARSSQSSNAATLTTPSRSPTASAMGCRLRSTHATPTAPSAPWKTCRPASSTSTPRPSAPKSICRSAAPRRPATATAKAARKCSTSSRSGRPSTSITPASCNAHRSTPSPVELAKRVLCPLSLVIGNWRSIRAKDKGPMTNDPKERAMIVGLPKEVKDNESRVGLVPAGVKALTDAGHQVFLQKSAGQGSGISHEEFVQAGGEILGTAEEGWSRANMGVKVKEPIASEYGFLREDLVLVTYPHPAPA